MLRAQDSDTSARVNKIGVNKIGVKDRNQEDRDEDITNRATSVWRTTRSDRIGRSWSPDGATSIPALELSRDFLALSLVRVRTRPSR